MSIPIPVLPHFSAIAADYDALLCDVWGVVHNGVRAFAPPCEALLQARSGGAVVVFITNAPRPNDVIVRQLERLGVPREAYDDIVTSGDVTRNVIAARRGQRPFHLGPARDRSIFAGLDVRLASFIDADYVVCSGLNDDEVETPDNYRAQLAEMLARKMFMICANPDIVVERGGRLVHCAGGLADLYAEMGGEVLYAGKPYRPIYDLALEKAGSRLGRQPDLRRVLAIGDSVRTDLAGAHAFGIDCLFVTSGIHAEELGDREQPQAHAISGLFATTGGRPKAVMQQLAW